MANHLEKKQIGLVFGVTLALFGVSVSKVAGAADSVYVKGSHGVSQLGALTSQIPVEIPPGTAGLQPSISFAYSSQTANGLLGKGWTVTGLSVISRCPATVAQDGYAAIVTLTTNDRFCLDGMKLLAVSGTYGANGTEYRTETESFNRVYSYGTSGTGPAYFMVMRPNGQLAYYGNTSDSQMLGAGADSNILIWGINHVQDLENNYYDFVYNNNSTYGEMYISQINYTGNTTAGTVPYNSVQFSYATRPDNAWVYRSDVMMSTTVRLTDIKTYEGGTVSSGVYSGGTEVLDYQLSYQLSNESFNSLLTGVTVVSGDGSKSLLPFSFGWNSPNGGYASSVGVPANIPSIQTNIPATYTAGAGSGNSGSGIYSTTPTNGWLVGDFNGDGISDFVQLVSGASSVPVCISNLGATGFTCTNYALSSAFSSSGTAQFLTGDFDGDGLTDIVQVDSASSTMTVCYSQGDGTFSCASKSMPGITGAQFMAGDFNGDGLTDVVEIGPSGSSTVETCLSQGRSIANICGSYSPPTFTSNGATVFAGDFNGDGITDFIQFNGNTPTVCYGGSLYFDCQIKSIVMPSNFTGTPSSWFVGDFNGDGITDFAIYSVVTGGGGELYVCTTPQGGGGGCHTVGFSVPSVGGVVQSPYAVADFNNDGKADILIPFGSNWQLCYAGSDGSENCTTFAMSLTSSSSIAMVGGFTGDGMSSIIMTGPSYSSLYLNSALSTQPDLMTNITNGLGATTTITYAPLTNSSIYSKNSGVALPLQSFINTSYVVANREESDGVGGMREYTYNYTSGLADTQGRGFLGFAQVTEEDVNANVQVTTLYDQYYPYIGYPLSTTTSILNGNSWSPAKQSSYLYNIESFGGTRDFVYLSQETDKNIDYLHGTLADSVTSTYTYDNYGNREGWFVTTSDGYQQVNATFYNNITGGPGSIWYLGQLSVATQTNQLADGTTVGRTTQYLYGNSSFPNELTEEKLEPSGSAPYLNKTYGYDTFGNRNSVSITGSGMSARNTSYTFDSLGQFPTTVTNAYSQSETRTYDPRFGTITKLIDINSQTTQWTYDVLGRKTNETRPDTTQSNATYTVCTSGCGQQTYNVQLTNTGQPTVTKYFDILDREYETATGGFNSSTIYHYKTYDNVGRLASQSRNMYSTDTPYYTKYYYDSASRISLEADPDGSSRKWAYNNLSVKMTDNNGHTRIETKDSLGQLVQVVDANHQTTHYKYDPFGNLMVTTDPLGNQIQLSYDIMGRKTKMVDPDLGTWTYTYNGIGDLLSVTDANGHTQSMTYDNLGRMTTHVAPEFTSTWTYDTATHGIGKLASVTNGTVSKSYTYDSYGRPASETSTLDTTYTISTAYDSSGRINQVTYPDSFAVTYSYDSNGYLKEIDNASTLAMYWKRTAQNADNLPVTETLGNGIISGSTYYGPTGRLNTIVATPTSGPNVQSLTLAYDSMGNTTARTDLVNSSTGTMLTETYTYDKLNRMTGASNPLSAKHYSYDALGDMTAKDDIGTMKYGNGTSGLPLHGLVSTSGPTNYTFTYDSNGNMTSGEGRTLTWTSFNKPSNISNSANSVTFSYDSNFERYKEVETTCQDYLGGTDSTCAKYMINPRPDLGIHYEKEITGSITTYRHFITAGAGNVVAVYTNRSDGSLNTRYPHKDHLGSIVLNTDESGNVVERLAYDAFGKRRNAIGTDDPHDLLRSVVSHQGYTGQEHIDDGGLGLIDMNGRVVDPLLGRFLSADPHVQAPYDPQNLNRYAYALNNPVSSTDPSGYWFLNDVVNWVGGAINTVGNAISDAGKWIGHHAADIGIAIGIAVASVVTFGIADAALGAAGLSALGSSIIAGAISGAVAGGLSSSLLGGGFSWKAVGFGALAGAFGGAAASLTSGLGSSAFAIPARIGISALAGGLSSWTAAELSGHGSWNAFFQGAWTGGLIAAASIGFEYLTGNDASSASSAEGSSDGATDSYSGNSQEVAYNDYNLGVPGVPGYFNELSGQRALCGVGGAVAGFTCGAIVPEVPVLPSFACSSAFKWVCNASSN